MNGRFITLEGGEGTGKSTQLRKLSAWLHSRGIAVVSTREPGGSPGAEEIRRLMVEGEPERWDALSETLLAYAARADHVARTIKPALESGKWVLSDRFSDSTFAYQGAGRGLAREVIRRIDSAVLNDFAPDLTLILDLDAGIGLQRAIARDGAKSRFEKFDIHFHQRLRQAYLDTARRYPARCRVIDAGGCEEQVGEAIVIEVQNRFEL